ncbi:hypothetical protein [Aureimonas flava]|nr:hypothetical protein [Aureimonas flava]
MSGSKHTPGPWQLEGNWSANGRKLGGWVSTMHPSPIFELSPLVGFSDEIVANARLIAAAPELLAMLREARLFVQAQDHVFERIDAIIAKAEGRS